MSPDQQLSAPSPYTEQEFEDCGELVLLCHCLKLEPPFQQWFSTRGNCDSHGTFGNAGDILCLHNKREGKGREAAKHSKELMTSSP